MTNEEAIEKLKEECMNMIEDCECDNGKCACHIHKAIESLEKQDKYRWHDLRKNPDDLPEDFYSVLICLRGFEGREAGVTIAMHNSELNIWGSWSCSYKDYEIIAWKELEPFEGVE